VPERRAWFFDPTDFNSWLAKRVVSNNRLDMSAFRALIGELLHDNHLDSSGYLRTLDFDAEKYLHEAGGNELLQHAWYAAAMVGRLSSGNDAPYDFVINQVTERAGLTVQQRRRFLYGDPLSSLALASNIPSFVTEIAPYLDDYVFGGWLSVTRADELLKALRELRDQFEHPPADLIEMNRQAGLRDEPRLRTLFNLAFQAERTILEESIRRGEAIRIVSRG
jgi:hypothetical protein